MFACCSCCALCSLCSIVIDSDSVRRVANNQPMYCLAPRNAGLLFIGQDGVLQTKLAEDCLFRNAAYRRPVLSRWDVKLAASYAFNASSSILARPSFCF